MSAFMLQMADAPLVLSNTTFKRIFPLNRRNAVAVCKSLSILDNTLLTGPATVCVWLWEQDTKGALNIETLIKSLCNVLDVFPWFCGQLRQRSSDPAGDHTQRPGCLEIEWGSERDPGAELCTSNAPGSITDLVPSLTERAGHGGVWVHSAFPKLALAPPTILATMGPAAADGLPCFAVQLTKFEEGGLAMSVKWPHSLCDMASAMTFMRAWAAVHRATASVRLPAVDAALVVQPPPCFEPHLVDNHAAGDIDGPHPDAELLRIAATLPRVRWDWWATAEDNCPPPMLPMLRLPPEVTRQAAEPFGPPVPWLKQWEWRRPTRTCLIDFTQSEVDAMLREARAGTAARTSVNDVINAHMASEICKAKCMQSDEEPVHLTMVLSLRSRLNPPLPAEFMGCPFVFGCVTLSGREWCTAPLSQLAAAIRAMVAAHSGPTLPALLHEMAHELTPQRRVGYAVGRHMVSASWERDGVYDLDFGQAGRPRLAEYAGPQGEGTIQILKPAADGLTVLLVQTPEVLERLTASTSLRKFHG